MKKFIKIVLPVLLISILCYFGFQIVTKIQQKKEVAENIKTLPIFEYKNIKGDLFSNKNLKTNTSKLFIYYNSECDFCNEEAKMIEKNIEELKHIQILFISFEPSNKIEQFSKKSKLDIYENVIFLCDTNSSFATTFDVKSMPCLVLYDKNNNLIEKIKGQVKIQTVLEKFQN